MTAKIGYNSYVAYGEESSFGTLAAPATFIEYSSESLKKEIDEKLIEAINGGNQFTKRVTLGERVGGGIDFPLTPSSFLKLFKHLSGDAGTTTTLTTGVYQHVFVFNARTTNTSFTWQACRDTSDTATSFNYTGCKVNTASFKISSNDILGCSVDMMGKEQAAANTISTASYSTFNPFTFKDATVIIGDSAGSTTSYNINDWSLNIGNNLLDDTVLGSATRNVIEPAMQDITYEIGMKYESNDLINRFLNKTKSYIKATFDTGNTIASTYTHKIQFESWNCYFNGSIPNIGSASEIIKHNLPLRAIKEDASVGSLKITLVTNVATI